ncbi:MAG: arginine--tRNA ligase [Gammaproteobacteria bacterium]
MKQPIKTAITTALLHLQQQHQLPASIDIDVQVERTRDPQHGDYACNIAMLLAKPCQKNPLLLAEMIQQALPSISGVATVSIAKPGFINFKLETTQIRQVVSEVLNAGPNYGCSELGQAQPIHIEIVSANPTGPLHVGHGRLAAYSASLANVLDAAGYRVHREYYVNDAGRQMRILAVSLWLRYLELLGETLPFPRRGYKGDYMREIAQQLKVTYLDRFYRPQAEIFKDLPTDDEAQEEAYIDALILRAEALLGAPEYNIVFQYGLDSILGDIQEDLEQFGVTCQNWFLESELDKTGDIAEGIATLQAGGLLYENEGAVWFRATEFGDEKDRVVVRDNGQPTYFASDVGYHLNKLKRGFTQLLDVYGADHHGYAPRLRALIIALGMDVKKLHVLLVQFAILYRGKTRVSMSTRGGEFVTLRELREEVGNDAARFFYIMRRREQHLDFDLELAKSQSSDNPVYYIQYAHARVCSVLRQLEQKGWRWDAAAGDLTLLNEPQELDLMRSLSCYPEKVELAATSYEPAVLAHYLQELANYFHIYYNALSFLVEDAPLRNARLNLIIATRQVLANGLMMLGVSTPESM